ncbi:MAG TPA: DUF669 domain-containing protein [Spirochaetales bacterium]|nr:DUF669 domain-containing protein [Spirochaetales bacterium]
MANLGNFNADEHENEFTPIPTGKYPAVITESKMVGTKNGGQMLKLTHEIIDGPNKGRKVWANLNLVHSNDQAVKIAKINLADICRAVGVLHPRDSSELHNKPMVIKLSIRPETDEYPASNDIKAWEPMNKAPQLQGMAPDASTPAAKVETPAPDQAPASNKKPWEK